MIASLDMFYVFLIIGLSLTLLALVLTLMSRSKPRFEKTGVIDETSPRYSRDNKRLRFY